MEATTIIESNIGYPIIIFYTITLLTITLLYQKKLKFFFSLLFVSTIIAFNSSLWELPIMLTGPMNQGGFITGLAYLIPMPLFILVYNIKLDYNTKKVVLLITAITVSLLYGYLYPHSLYYQLGQYYSLGYLTTFIPRTLSLISLTYLCYPNTKKSKFNIQKVT